MLPPPPLPTLVAPGAGAVFRLLGEVVTCKATADDTGGAYALFALATPPRGGTPPRRHHLEDVAYFVLAGVYAVRVGGETRRLGPGAYAFVPRGTVQAYRNVGRGPARMLVLVSPGGIHERFLAEVGAPRADGAPPDVGKVLAAAPKYGVEFLPLEGMGR